MSSNIPVSTLSAALTLDTSGFESGVKRAEMLTQRWAKSQQDAFASMGNPNSAMQVTGAWIQQIEKASQASTKIFSRITGPQALGLPTADTSAFIDQAQQMADEIADGAEKAAARRLAIERATIAEQIRLINERKAAEDAAQAETERGWVEAAARRMAITRASNQALEDAAEREAARQEQADKRRAQIMTLRARADDVRQQSRFDLANPFEKQVMASEKLNTLLAQRRALQRGTIEFAEKELEIARQIATVRSIRSDLTVTTSGIRNLGNTAADSQERMRTLNLRLLQGGYQLQDFVVQVGSGTNALVAFAQQSSQFAGFFGTTGAWVGVGLAVASLAANMFLLSSRTKEANKQAEVGKNAWDDYAKTASRIRFNNLSEEQQRSSLEARIKAARKAQQEIAELQNRLGQVGTEDLGLYAMTLGKSIQEGYQKWVFPTLEQQLKYQRAVLDAQSKGQSAPSALEDRFGGGAVNLLAGNPISGPKMISSLMKEIEEASGKGATSLLELGDQLRKLDTSRLEKVAELVQQTAVDVGQYDAEVDEARRANMQFGETNIQALDRLRQEWVWLTDASAGAVDALEVEKTRGKILTLEDALAKEAQAITDQLDPLAKKRRELEEIRKLEMAGFLDKGTADIFTARLKDQIQRAIKLPDMFSLSKNAQTTGGFTGSAQPNVQVELTRKMLVELGKISNYTALMAGDN